jgi:hypothetical protein
MKRRLVLSTRASAVAYTNGARICFNKPLSAALVANANSEVIAPDQLLIAA